VLLTYQVVIVIQGNKNANYSVFILIVCKSHLLIVVRLCCLYLTVHRLPLWTENLDLISNLTRFVDTIFDFVLRSEWIMVPSINWDSGGRTPPLHVPLTCKLILNNVSVCGRQVGWKGKMAITFSPPWTQIHFFFFR